MPILSSMLLPRRFAIIAMVAALALAQAPAATAANIFVENMNCSTSSEEFVRELFERNGTVYRFRVIKDRDGRSTGNAFVEMPSEKEAEAAVHSLHGIEVEGNTLAACRT